MWDCTQELDRTGEAQILGEGFEALPAFTLSREPQLTVAAAAILENSPCVDQEAMALHSNQARGTKHDGLGRFGTFHSGRKRDAHSHNAYFWLRLDSHCGGHLQAIVGNESGETGAVDLLRKKVIFHDVPAVRR